MWHPTRNAEQVARSEKTKSSPRSPKPTVDGSRRGGSAGLEPLFSGVLWIGALDPALGDSSQRTPSRESVARMVCPLTRSLVSPSSKLTSAASLSVQRVLCLPNPLGERCSSSRRESALCSSKAAWTSVGREEIALRASSPRLLKSWMASRTVCCPHPRFLAICGARSPRALAKSIWQRRSTKASEERRPSSSASRSSLESVRTKIGGLMFVTITHSPKPVLDVH